MTPKLTQYAEELRERIKKARIAFQPSDHIAAEMSLILEAFQRIREEGYAEGRVHQRNCDISILGNHVATIEHDYTLREKRDYGIELAIHLLKHQDPVKSSALKHPTEGK